MLRSLFLFVITLFLMTCEYYAYYKTFHLNKKERKDIRNQTIEECIKNPESINCVYFKITEDEKREYLKNKEGK